MLLPPHLADVYAEMLESIDSELVVLDDRVYIDTLDGRIEIDDEGFINHFNFKRGAKNEEQIINFALLISAKISPITRSFHAIF